MQDIKRPSRNLRFSKETRDSELFMLSQKELKAREKKIEDEVDRFERDDYSKVRQSEKQIDKRDRVNNFYNRKPETARDYIIKPKKTKSSSSFAKAFYYLIGIAGFVYFLLTFVFNSSIVTVTPKTAEASIANEITFNNSTTSSVKTFEIIDLEKSITSDIPKSEKKLVQSKAEGYITVYNDYGSDPQKLIKNTRFESSSGKIFRITESISVPGKTSSGPGSVKVKVSADSIGADYNIAEDKFTIPGFKGSDRYGKFYGKSDSPMSGGSNQEKFFVSKTDVDRVINDLSITLKDQLKEEMKLINKDGYKVITDVILTSSENNLPRFESGEDEKFKLTMKAKVVLVNSKKLSSAIALASLSNYTGEEVEIRDYSNLSFTLPDNTLYSELNENQVKLKISGKAMIVYKVNNDELKNELIGKSANQDVFNVVLSKFPSIEKAKSVVSPFWVNTYPNNVNKLEIVEDLTKDLPKN